MAAASRKPLDLSKKELSNIQSALKDETFVKLLAEYARELNDPENKKKYEAEIAQLEAERGYDVAFVHPQPGYVIKVAQQANNTNKLFINICSEIQVERPVSVSGSQGGQSGLCWSIPYSLSQPREDVDRSGKACTVFDVIFHPDTLYLAEKDQRIKGLVHSTAFDALETSFNVKVDQSSVKFPNLKFKGVFRPTVIRKPLKNNQAETPAAPPAETPSATQAETPSATPADTPAFAKPAEVDLDPITPQHSIRYRSAADLQDHLIQPTNIALSNRPKELVVEVDLPLLGSAAGIDLDVQEKSLTLVKESPPRHRLHLQLPYPVNEEHGAAKFDKSTKCLIITLPVKQGPVMKTERLSSNDSGIECEEGYRTRGSIASDDEAESDKPNSSDPQDNPQGVQEDHQGSSAHPQLMNEYRTNDLDGFWEPSQSYLFPNFTHVVQGGLMILTLEVKNVAPESVQFKVIPGKLAVQLKFSSVGSGHFPIHYAFYLDFTMADVGGRRAAEVRDLAEIETECWDNNVVLQLPYAKDLAWFRVGSSPQDLKDKVYLAEKSENSRTLSLKVGGEVAPKYLQEKHPKLMKQAAVKEAGLDIPPEKERHSSGESLDSSMSCSPYDRYNLEQKTEESEAEEDKPRFERAVSSESHLRVRGILKRRKVQLPGSRFRCYSESNAADHWTNSNNQLSTTLSETRIDEGEEFEHSEKKTVRFSEKVQQQLYRINSSIVAKTAKNKKKAEKKKKAVSRRLSESDTVDLKEPEGHHPLQTSRSLDSFSQDYHEDSGLASSFEENMVIDSGSTKVKTKRRTKKRTKTFEMSNDLIFDLDI